MPSAAPPPAASSGPSGRPANAPAECEAIIQRINKEGERIKAVTDVFTASKKDKPALESFVAGILKARDGVRAVPVTDKKLLKLSQRYQAMLDRLVHGARTVNSTNADIQRRGLEELNSIDAEETEIINAINSLCGAK